MGKLSKFLHNRNCKLSLFHHHLYQAIVYVLVGISRFTKELEKEFLQLLKKNRMDDTPIKCRESLNIVSDSLCCTFHHIRESRGPPLSRPAPLLFVAPEQSL
ncbi:hypothetical protein CEXT_297061 [Caerostris extrusa]|uniref:Uncharacterized protein n=1 Tax=Caerostris extrusa TaxID=172846 RepID=A0AAV4UQU1_CAEEX|nr:hypothetical protein CEXT_297061 [Caerostris extrusa]